MVVGEPPRLPLGMLVQLLLRANDVIHNFYVPEFRIKMDAVPGMVTRIWLTPTRLGAFQAVCAEYCGLGHARMLGPSPRSQPPRIPGLARGPSPVRPRLWGSEEEPMELAGYQDHRIGPEPRSF